MIRSVAEKLKLFVNTPGVEQGLSEYMEYRIQELKNKAIDCSSFEELKGYQFAIQELKRLKTLREEVNKAGES